MRTTSRSDDLLIAQRFFRRHGYVAIRSFFTTAQIFALADALKELHELPDHREYCGLTRGRISFIRTAHLWSRSSIVRDLAFDQRLGKLVCDLLGVEGVRLISDDLFYKPPRARVSSWHYDREFVPIDRDDFVSVWIPLTPATKSSGALAYASGSHTEKLPKPRWPFRHEVLSHLWYQAFTRLHGTSIETVPVDVGDILIHHGRTLHKAHANNDLDARIAFGINIVDARSKFVAPTNKEQIQHVEAYGWSTLKNGDEIAVPLAPVVYQR
jgi:hypothetical protein